MGFVPCCDLLDVTAHPSCLLGPSGCSCVGSLPPGHGDCARKELQRVWGSLRGGGGEGEGEEAQRRLFPALLISAFLSLAHPSWPLCWTHPPGEEEEDVTAGSKSREEET